MAEAVDLGSKTIDLQIVGCEPSPFEGEPRVDDIPLAAAGGFPESISA